MANGHDDLFKDAPENEHLLRQLKPGDRSFQARAARMLGDAAKRAGIVFAWRCTKCEATARYARRAPQPSEYGCRALPGGDGRHEWTVAAKYRD